MKETKFYMTFMIYIVLGTLVSTYVFGLMSGILSVLNNYMLVVTIAVPILILFMFLAIIGSSELAFVTSFAKQKIDKEVFLPSLKIMLEGIGIVVIAVPTYYLIQNTMWTITTGYNQIDIPLGGLIVSSLIIVGGICVLSQTYVTLAAAVDKHNKLVKAK